MFELCEVQDSIAGALLDVAAPVPNAIRGARRRRAARRFDVYRRILAKRLIDHLSATFPVTRQMVGEEPFAALARSFTVKFPPQSPALLRYGDLFAPFIRSLGRAPSIDYLADVATLEAGRWRAYHAADEKPLPAKRLSQARRVLGGLVMRLHPSSSLIQSRFPVVSVWESSAGGSDTLLQWAPEAALICRPETTVQVWRLPPGGHAFLTEIMNGTEVEAAAQRASVEVARFDLDQTIDLLTMANACVGLNKVSVLAA